MKLVYRFGGGKQIFSAYGPSEQVMQEDLVRAYGENAAKYIDVVHVCNCNSQFGMHCQERDVFCRCNCHTLDKGENHG